MDKEELEKFDKEQLDILLNDLQDIDKFTGFKDGAFKYELGKYQANLLVNCIKKQKEVIDKAIKYIECNKYTIKHYEPYGTPTGLSNYETYNIKGYHQLLDILKEVSDE